MEIQISFSNFIRSLPKVDLVTYDVGNTHIKKANFKNGSLIDKKTLGSAKDLKESINSLKDPYVLSSVRNEIHSTFSHRFKSNKFFNMPVLYEESLGNDRLITSYLIYNLYKSETILVDFGTFITIDLIVKTGLQGGFILPGLKLLGLTYDQGEKLQRPSKAYKSQHLNEINPSFPQNTEDAIQNGHNLVIRGITEQIKQLSQKRELVITGGDAHCFQSALPYAFHCPDLIHYSMYFQHFN